MAKFAKLGWRKFTRGGENLPDGKVRKVGVEKIYQENLPGENLPIKLASLLILIAIGCCFDSLSRSYSGLQKLLYRSRLLQTAICHIMISCLILHITYNCNI